MPSVASRPAASVSSSFREARPCPSTWGLSRDRLQEPRLAAGRLAELDYIHVEEGQDLPLLRVSRRSTSRTAALVVRRQHIGAGGYDLGFARGTEGYFPIISDFDRRTLFDREFCPNSGSPMRSASSRRSERVCWASVRRTTESSVVKLRVRY